MKDYSSFRRWTYSSSFPEGGCIDFVAGGIWVDLSKEDLFLHNRVRGAISSVLYQFTEETAWGLFIFDRMRIVFPPTQLSIEPDAAFASQASLDAGLLKVASRPHRQGAIELVEAPDKVLEVISDSSVGKDRRVLRPAYWEAGVKEFWLVEVRGKRFDFHILVRESKGYELARLRDGWSKSLSLTRNSDSAEEKCCLATRPSSWKSAKMPPVTRVLLLRHGETALPQVFHGAESDVGLGERGWLQVRRTAPILAEHKPVAVISSAMRRAIQSAQPIAEACGVALQIEPSLHERKVGILSGMAFDTPVWQDTLQRWIEGETGYAPEGAESFDDIHHRVRPTWDRIADEYAGQTYVVVAHGVVVKVLACSLGVGLGPADWHHFRTHNMGINELVRSNGSWAAVRWADVRHLESTQ